MHPDFMSKLVALRAYLNFPFVLSSAFRCPEHNSAVSSTGSVGPHTTGRAVDIVVRGEQAYEVLANAARFGFTGIGVNQKGGSRFIHLDDLESPEYPRPGVWSY
jgi:uncharacterized protein YcbK (DUF882 family)